MTTSEELRQILAAMSRERRLAFLAYMEQRAKREGDLALFRCVRNLRQLEDDALEA